MDTFIICLKLVAILLLIILIIFLYNLRGFFLKYRSDLKLKRGVSPDTGRTIFYYGNNLRPSEIQLEFIHKYYGIDSLIIDYNDVYKISDVRMRSKGETENSCIGSLVFDVNLYPKNHIEIIPMNAYRRFLFILDKNELFIELSGYEYEMTSILSSLKDEELFIKKKLTDLLSGYPILITDALDVCSVVSFHLGNKTTTETSLLNLWQNIYSILHKYNDLGNTNVKSKQLRECTDDIITTMLSVLAEMSERCTQLQKRGEEELTGDFQNGISHVLNKSYDIQISREYTLGRAKKNLGETDLFFYHFQDGKKKPLYILENKVLSNFKNQYLQLMGYLNPYFLAGITLSINIEKGWEEAYDYIYDKLMIIQEAGGNFAPETIERVSDYNGTIYIKTFHTVPETGYKMPVYHLVFQLSDDARMKVAISARH